MAWRPVRSLGRTAAVLAALCIIAGPVWSLDRLDFRVSGGSEQIVKAVRDASLVASMEAGGQTEPQDMLAAARSDYGRILAALYAKGHYSAVIRISVDGREAASISALEVPEKISAIAISVDPGPPFRFNSVRISPLAEDTNLPAGFRVGQPAESALVGEAFDSAIRAWRELGHAKAEIAEESVTANHSTASLDVDLRIAEGPRLRFGALAVDGEVRMREQRIRKIAGLPVGKTFSETELLRAEERLRRTGIFSSVKLTEDEDVTSPDLLGITATVVEQKPRRYSFGAEVASLDGLSLEGSWLHRNLMGGGERLKVEGSATNIGSGQDGMDYVLGVSLDRPATLTPDTTAGLSLNYVHLEEADYSLDGFEFGLNFVHVFSDKLTAKAGLTYSVLTGSDPTGDLVFRNLSMPLSVTWDRRDNFRDARKGFYLDVGMMPFLGFGTTGSGIRGTFDGRVYHSLGSGGRLVLALRAQGGAIVGSDLIETPFDMLFLSGGGGTVRGQPYRSLGIPIDLGMGETFTIGGRYFLAGSAELRVKVSERVGFVGFVDLGSVGLEGFSDGADTHAGAGLGLRYDTGFGPIRLDVAAPISGTTGEGMQIYVGLGQAF